MKDKFNFTYFATEIMASYFLFPTYTIFFAWCIYKSKWVGSSGLPVKYLILFFILKIVAACAYGYWYSHAEHADTWSFHHYGLIEYKLLFTDTPAYLTNIFSNERPWGWGNIFANKDAVWSDLIVKMISIMDIFSLGNYYVNTIFYSFITFFSFIFLYKSLRGFFGTLTRGATFFLFLTPSCLFWTSGIHKDGLVLLFISIIVYQLYKIVTEEKITAKGIFVSILFLILLFMFRSYVFLGLFPSMLALLISHFYNKKSWKVFLPVFILSVFLFFLTSYIGTEFSLPHKIIGLRTDFQQLSGTSRLDQSVLTPDASSFIRHVPEALDHALLRPYLWDSRGIAQLIAGMEVFFFILVVVLTIVFRRRISQKPISWFIICFSLSVLLFVGLVVSFAGAIVRYRAIYLMLLFVVCLQYLDFRRLRDFSPKPRSKI